MTNIKDIPRYNYFSSCGTISGIVYEFGDYKFLVEDLFIDEFEKSYDDLESKKSAYEFLSILPNEYCLNCLAYGFENNSVLDDDGGTPHPGDGLGWCSNHYAFGTVFDNKKTPAVVIRAKNIGDLYLFFFGCV